MVFVNVSEGLIRSVNHSERIFVKSPAVASTITLGIAGCGCGVSHIVHSVDAVSTRTCYGGVHFVHTTPQVSVLLGAMIRVVHKLSFLFLCDKILISILIIIHSMLREKNMSQFVVFYRSRLGQLISFLKINMAVRLIKVIIPIEKSEVSHIVSEVKTVPQTTKSVKIIM